MKKIVGLLLSMVMVLSIFTTSSAINVNTTGMTKEEKSALAAIQIGENISEQNSEPTSEPTSESASEQSNVPNNQLTSKQTAMISFEKTTRVENYKKGEILIQFLTNVETKEINSYIGKQGLKIEEEIDENLYLTSFNSNKLKMGDLMSSLNGNEHIVFAEPNYIRKQSRIAPVDNTYYNLQWGLFNKKNGIDINVNKAWEITKGSSAVVVGVIDSGIALTHKDISNNIWENTAEISGNRIDDDNNGYVDDVQGWNFLTENADSMDQFDHGTHVSGIIAAEDNKEGIVGVAPKISLASLKVGDNSFDTVDIVEAIKYGKKQGFKIYNCSYSSEDFSNAEMYAMKSANALFVCAAGNDGVNVDKTPYYPASYAIENIISVGAVDENGNLAEFSNYGVKNVDICAPGVDIMSLLVGDDYGAGDGTSMAAPFVTGIAALVMSVNKDLGPLDVKKVILENGKVLSNLGTKISKSSIVDAYAAVVASSTQKLIPVAGVAFNRKELNLYRNDIVELKPVISPWDASNQQVTWMTSDKEVATVDEMGFVTAVFPGKAVVSATTVDGTKIANCNVNVLVPVPKIYKAGETFKLKIETPDVISGNVKIYMIKPNGDFAKFDGTAVAGVANKTDYTYVNIAIDIDGIIGKNEIDPLCDFGTWEIDSVVSNSTEKGSMTFANEKYYKTDAKEVAIVYLDDSKFAIKSPKGQINDNTGKLDNKALVVTGDGKPKFESIDFSEIDVPGNDVSGAGVLSSDIYIGNYAKIKVFAKDSSGIWTGKVTFVKPDGKEAVYPLLTDSRDGYYYCALKIVSTEGAIGEEEINSKLDAGIWKVKSVELENINGAKAEYASKDFSNVADTEDMSNANFNVLDKMKMMTSIRPYKSSGSIFVGRKIRVIYDALPLNSSLTDLKWVSSNKRIATVSSTGVITGVSKGTAVIQGISKDGSGVKLSYSISVKRFYYITKLTIPYSITIYKGKYYRITPKIYPYYASNRALSYSSSVAGVITIDSKGTIVGLKSGKTTIKVKATDGSGKYDYCYVTVK